METCDVLIVGGGPAGSTCAWKLNRAGFDVMVADRAAFPRDKVCAGWITPQVVASLQFDIDDYRRGRTFQTISGFETGIVGQPHSVRTHYSCPVSFGIRRCEFDHYLLARAGARMALETAVSSLRRERTHWVVNDAIRARMLVGAGGHFCPVARWLNPRESSDRLGPVVAAREAEFRIPEDAPGFSAHAETPSLYFCSDLAGYGWCFRKGHYVNVGFGRVRSRSLARATDDFVSFLASRGIVPAMREWPWHGHAYSLYPPPGRVVDDAVLLVGDAAGLAYAQSGEGIRPAVESGLMAADAIIAARGQYDREGLRAYEQSLRQRFDSGPVSRVLGRLLPESTSASWARGFLRSPRFVRHVLLDRWFLHAGQPALAAG